MKPRIYIDISVIRGYFDDEFQDFSRLLFDRIINKDFMIFFSEVNKTELSLAPLHIQSIEKLIPPDCHHYLELNNESKDLAEVYIEEKALGKGSLNDAYHIAIASTNRLDCLIS